MPGRIQHSAHDSLRLSCHHYSPSLELCMHCAVQSLYYTKRFFPYTGNIQISGMSKLHIHLLIIHSFIPSFIHSTTVIAENPFSTAYRNMKSVQRKRTEDKPIPLRNHFKSDKVCCRKERLFEERKPKRHTDLTQLYKGHSDKHSTITMQASLHQSNLGQCPYDASHHLISLFRIALKRAGFW